jgi:hypothetical protein
MMALAVAKDNPTGATSLLRESFARLDEAAAQACGSNSPTNPATVAAALLPIAERTDPSLVAELFWRCVSYRVRGLNSTVQSDAVLALLLGRFDPVVGRRLLDPLPDRARNSGDLDLAPIIAALAVLDPDRALKFVEELPDPSDLTFHQIKNQARLELTAALLRTTPACWDDATVRYLHLTSQTNPDEN